MINNASTDDTKSVARRECSKYEGAFDYRILDQPLPGKGNALELGFRYARGRYIVVCDDDIWLEANYMRKAVEIMDVHPEVGALRGRAVSMFEAAKPDWWEKYQYNFGVTRPNIKSGDVTERLGAFGGAGTVLRKSALDELYQAGYSFFNPFRGEDFELCLALRIASYRLWYEQSLFFKHLVTEEKLSWRNFLEKTALNGRRTPIWRAFEEVIDGKFSNYRLPHRFYWIRKVLPSVVNGHLTRVVIGIIWLQLRNHTQIDRYRSLIYQANVWLGYMALRGRFVEMIRRAAQLQERLKASPSDMANIMNNQV